MLLLADLVVLDFARSTVLDALAFGCSSFSILIAFGPTLAACTVFEVSPHTFVLSFQLMPALLQAALVSGWPELLADMDSGAVSSVASFTLTPQTFEISFHFMPASTQADLDSG